MAESFMLAEMREQPDLMEALAEQGASELRPLRRAIRTAGSLLLLGSGSSLNAAIYAADAMEAGYGLPVRVSAASEAFRSPVPEGTVAIALSHSGASTDVLRAVARAKRRGVVCLGLSNLSGTPLERAVDSFFGTGAGPERAVPSTKGFTALFAACHLLAAGSERKLDSARRRLARASEPMRRALRPSSFADRLSRCRAAIFLGDGRLYPVARDGALKLLEVTQIPSLALPSAELRHGPIAMAGPGVAGVAVTPLRLPVESALRRQGAFVLALTRPRESGVAVALVQAVRLQRLAHDAGVRLGRTVDAPPGLQKVVRR